MRAYEQILGKVSITPEGDWENKEYNRLSLVRYPSTGKVYLSKKDVPADVEITNTEYWMFVFESLTREELDYILSHFASFVVVSELPQTGDGRKIYLLGPIGTGSDRYEEYIYTEGSWIKIGDTSIDLSGYLSLSGGTMSGPLTNNDWIIAKNISIREEPQNDTDGVPKKYVDDNLNEYVKKSVSIPFTNPVGPWKPDPCFWKGDDGYFYIKGTGRTNTTIRTRNFVDYEDTGKTFLSQEAQDQLFTLYGHYATDNTSYKLHPHQWAPYVIKIGNNWIMYMAVVERTGTKDAPEDGTAHIVALTSKTPYGYFSNPVTIVTDNEVNVAATSSTKWNNVIDPFVYCDPYDNHIYLLAGSSYGIRRKRLTDDGLAMYNDGGTEAVDNYAMHVAGQSINTDPTRTNVFEGAYLYSKTVKIGNSYSLYDFLFVSSGTYSARDYCVKVGRRARDERIGGTSPINFADKSGAYMRNGGGETILSTESETSAFWGPGHIGGIFETEDGKTWMLYHCHDSSGEYDRKLFIQELLWDENGWPYFGNNGHPIEQGEISKYIITDTKIVEDRERIFIAVESHTLFADIKAATDAGREVLCESAAGYSYLIEKTNSYITFASLPSSGHNGLSRRLTVDNNNNWTISYVGFDLLYDTTNKKLKKNYGGSTYDDVVTAEKIVEDGRITVELSSIIQSDMSFINGSGNSFSRSYTEADFTAVVGSAIVYALKTDTQGAKNVYFIIKSVGIGGYVTHGLRYNTNYYWELIYFDVDRTKHISIKLVYDSTNLEWTISGEVLTW